MPGHDISKIGAVIVTHDPDDRVFTSIEKLIKQAGHIWIIDNGSGDDSRKALEKCRDEANGRITLVANSENLGLAKAQNIGIDRALDTKCDWVLMLDDDSIPGDDMVRRMVEEYERSTKKDKVGMMCPRLEDEGGSVKSQVFVSSGPFHFARRILGKGMVINGLAFAIASGSLIPARVFREVGTMKENFFIDYIDIEFSFRLRKAGFSIIAVGDAVLNHRLGETEQRKVLNKDRNVRSHSAARRYYIYRNRIRVWKMYGLRMPAYILFELAAIAIDLTKLLLAESDKKKKFKSILKGVRDGITG